MTECFFKYGPSTSYGAQAPCAEYETPPGSEEWQPLGTPAELGEGSAPVPVRSPVSLESGTTYHFQLYAANENNAPGEQVGGGDLTLATPGAQISEVSADQISSGAARINAWIDPKGEATSFHVQYTTQAAFEASGWSGASETAATAVAARRAPPPPTSRPPPAPRPSTNGSNLLTAFATASGEFAVGQAIEGTGLPAKTEIVAIDTVNHRLTLNKAATAGGTTVPLSAGSSVITNLTTTSGRLLSEQDGHRQAIAGAGIAPGTTIVSVIGTEAVLSKPATVAGKAVALTATGPQAVHRQLAGLPPTAPTTPASWPPTRSPSTRPRPAFATYPVATVLPDGRAYEKVTPSHKAGEAIPPPLAVGWGAAATNAARGKLPTLPAQAAPDGEAVLYAGQPFAAGLASGPNQYRSARGPSGWDWQSLSPPTTTGVWQAFSSDLSIGVLEQTEPPLSPEAPSREGKGFANLYRQAQGGALSR